MIKRSKVLLTGYGKMGIEIEKLLEKDSRLELFAILDSSEGTTEGVKRYFEIEKIPSENCDIVIDFSSPELAVNVQKWCLKNKIPLVSGTTGLSPSQYDGFMQLAKDTAVLWAPNMSLGIAVIEAMLEKFTAIDDFDFQIEETHHNKKKDSPSGTAVLLQNRLKKVLARDLPEPLSIRGGGVFGIHRVHAMGPEETITIEHNALNRAVFARGAIRAARWIIGKPKGFYSIRDIISS